MKTPAWNLAGWWGRLTRQTLGEPPQVLPSVQPVVIAGDHSWLAWPPELAHGIAGFAVINFAGQIGFVALRPNSPGGLLVRAVSVYVGSGTNAACRWNIQPTPLGGGGVNSINPARPCRATVSATLAAASVITPAGDSPFFLGGVNGASSGLGFLTPCVPPIWVPPGRSFVMESDATNVQFRGSILFTELDTGSEL